MPTIACPGCHQPLTLPVNAEGQKFKCPGCGKHIRIAPPTAPLANAQVATPSLPPFPPDPTPYSLPKETPPRDLAETQQRRPAYQNRRDEEDDRREPRVPNRKEGALKNQKRLQLIALCLGGVVLFVGVSTIGLSYLRERNSSREAAQRPKTLAEVKKAVEGKTPKEVMSILGKPDNTYSVSTDDLSASTYEASWVYYRLLVDPATDKWASVWIRFYSGKVTSVYL